MLSSPAPSLTNRTVDHEPCAKNKTQNKTHKVRRDVSDLARSSLTVLKKKFLICVDLISGKNFFFKNLAKSAPPTWNKVLSFFLFFLLENILLRRKGKRFFQGQVLRMWEGIVRHLALKKMLRGNYSLTSYHHAFHAAAKACDLISM